MIKVQNLCKAFGQHKLFDRFSLEIPDGEFCIFAGVSGCGKTTLLNMIGALEPVDGGSIIVNGTDVTRRKNRRGYLRHTVGFLFQNFALVDNKTVRENLKLVKNDCRSDISPEEALARVALARLMIKRCALVLADEPTGSLDRQNAERVFELLEMLQGMGKTVLMATHDETFQQKGKRVIKL